MIRYLFRQLGKSERGATMIEFAIVALLFFIMIFGIVDFGWLLNGYITLTSAAQEGARLAIVMQNEEGNFDEGAIRDKVIEHARFFKPSDLDIDIKVGDNIGEETKIKVNGKLDLLVGLPPLPNSMNFQTSATMRQEQ